MRNVPIFLSYIPMRTSTAIFSFVAVVYLGGCRGLPVVSPAASALGGAGAIGVVERRDRATETLTAVFQMKLRKPDGSEEQSRGALVVQRPDRLRLQIFSLGVLTVFDYTVNRDRFRLRRPLDGVEDTGSLEAVEASPEGFADYDLRPLFLRVEPLTGGQVHDTKDAEIVTLGPEAARREIRISKRSGEIESETVYAAAAPRLQARYRDYRSVDGVPLPFHIDVEYPAARVSLGIEVSRYTRNQPVDPEIFEF